MKASPSYEEYRKHLFDIILDIPRKSKDFKSLYYQRKGLLKDLAESDLANYVAMSLQKGSERVFYLTDNTQIVKYGEHFF